VFLSVGRRRWTYGFQLSFDKHPFGHHLPEQIGLPFDAGPAAPMPESTDIMPLGRPKLGARGVLLISCFRALISIPIGRRMIWILTKSTSILEAFEPSIKSRLGHRLVLDTRRAPRRGPLYESQLTAAQITHRPGNLITSLTRSNCASFSIVPMPHWVSRLQSQLPFQCKKSPPPCRPKSADTSSPDSCWARSGGEQHAPRVSRNGP